MMILHVTRGQGTYPYTMVLTQFIFLNSRYGLRVVCQSKEWHDLVNVRALLSGMVGNGGQSPTVSQCFEPNQIAEVHYLP